MKLKKEEKLLPEFKPATFNEWKKLSEMSLKGKSLGQLIKENYENIVTKPIYICEVVKKDENFISNLPGFEPYLRGTGFINKEWDILQKIPEPEPKSFNKELKRNLSCGQNAIFLQIDEDSSEGLNPNKSSKNNAGRKGTSIFCPDDFSTALKNINIENHPVYIKIKYSPAAVAAMFDAFLQKSTGYSSTSLRMTKTRDSSASLRMTKGGFFYDPILTLAGDGFYPVSMEDAFNEIAWIITWANKDASTPLSMTEKGKLPRFAILTVNGNLFNDAGGNAVQELAFTFATAVEYIRELLIRGLNIDEIATRISLSYSIGPNFFIEIAKLRAARVLWAKIIKEFGGNEESMKAVIHAETCKWNKSKSSPYVNILRATGEAMSAIMGGCNSLSVGWFDDAFGVPGKLAKRLARNTQIILKEECEILDTADPAGGSWYVENLTAELAKAAWDLFRKVEKEGGMLKALKNGLPQKMLEEVRLKREKAISEGKDVLVGTNKYKSFDSAKDDNNIKPSETPEIALKTVFGRRAKSYKAHIEKRNEKQVKLSLTKLNAELKEKSPNSFDSIVEAASSGATLGEIIEVLIKGRKGVKMEHPIKKLVLGC